MNEVATLVVILDGYSEKGVHMVWRVIGYLICLKHLFRSAVVKNLIFFSADKTAFSFIRARHVLSYYLI